MTTQTSGPGSAPSVPPRRLPRAGVASSRKHSTRSRAPFGKCSPSGGQGGGWIPSLGLPISLKSHQASTESIEPSTPPSNSGERLEGTRGQTLESRRGGSGEQVAHDVGTKLPRVTGRMTDLGSLVSLLSLTNDGPETSKSSIDRRYRVVREHCDRGSRTRLGTGHRFPRTRLREWLEPSSPRSNTGEPMGTPHSWLFNSGMCCLLLLLVCSIYILFIH